MPCSQAAASVCVEVVDADRDVPVAGAEVVRAAVVVEGQLEHVACRRDAEEVVRRLELAVADDVHVALEPEAERLVERAARVRIRDPTIVCRKRAMGHRMWGRGRPTRRCQTRPGRRRGREDPREADRDPRLRRAGRRGRPSRCWKSPGATSGPNERAGFIKAPESGLAQKPARTM